PCCGNQFVIPPVPAYPEEQRIATQQWQVIQRHVSADERAASPMLTWLRARRRSRDKAAELYGSIVAAARREAFYAKHGVPDTPDGRFAMVVAHTFLVLERLRREGTAGRELSRAL